MDSLAINEYSSSIGVLTLICSLIGLGFYKKDSFLCYFTLFFIFINSCYIGEILVWKLFYYSFPGASGIRCIIRISFIALIILAIGSAKLIDSLKFKNKLLQSLLVISVVVICVIEQIPLLKDNNSNWVGYGWNKSTFIQNVEKFVAIVPNDCKILFLDSGLVYNEMIQKSDKPDYQKMLKIKDYNEMLAMWIALKKGITTLNGYNGLNKNPNTSIKEQFCTL